MKAILEKKQFRLKKGAAAWRPKPVVEHVILRSILGDSLYYLCPGCGIPLSREYMNFCDSCGQKLGWSAVTELDRLSERSQEEEWDTE